MKDEDMEYCKIHGVYHRKGWPCDECETAVIRDFCGTNEIEDYFASLAGNHKESSPYELPVKGLTVRLDAHSRAEISVLSDMTDMTRQDLLETLITSGIRTAIKAYLGNLPDKVSADFDHAVYEFMVDEGVHPEVAEHITGIQLDIFNNQGDQQQ